MLAFYTSSGSGFTGGQMYQRNEDNTAWYVIVQGSAGQTLGNKTINADENTIKDSTTNNAGDILVNNGTKFVRKARGSARNIVRMNDACNDIGFKGVGILRELFVDNLRDVVRVYCAPMRKGAYSTSASSGASVSDFDESLELTTGATVGNIARARNGGVPLDWGAKIFWYLKYFGSTSSTNYGVLLGVNIKEANGSDNMNKKIGIGKRNANRGTAKFDVISADGTTRSATASTVNIAYDVVKHLRLEYVPNDSLKFYENNSLNVAKTTNLPNSGAMASGEIYDKFEVQAHAGTNVVIRGYTHELI